ncbi:MAG TPA: hypothetical protein VFV67_30925 [Actinophytocola sp.]|uniref:hypothetical protein n=1 Tax=Actinophytocola sp. TaxID=1872138 RepID=UPI002DBEBBDD|nr:hypothetical protein [Actinophytocola sp.]HEU5475080.1 hypothetical protein [Actinophytocola sp.]
MAPTTLYRLAGIAGLLTGVLLLLNDARRVGVVPENDLTHSIAPIPAFLALFALTGLYLWQRERTGRLGLYGYALNLAGLAGALAIEFASHYVLRFLDSDTVERLVDGRTGTGFLVISMVYLAGIVLFGLASARAGLFPRTACALYVVGFVPTALRAVLPAPVVSIGFVLGSAAVIWMSWRLVTANTQDRLPVRI